MSKKAKQKERLIVNIVSEKRVEIQLIRDMRTDKVEGLHDSLRLPNDKGKGQIRILRRVMEEEGSRFHILFYSPAVRTYCSALALSDSKTILGEMPQLYDPNPNNSGSLEKSDAVTLLEARKRFGYDWTKWNSEDSVKDALARHAEVAINKFFANIKAIMSQSENRLPRDMLVFRVGVIGHFPYLNAMGMRFTRSSDVTGPCYKIPLAECERFVLNGPVDDSEERFYVETIVSVPLGEKTLQRDPASLN